jgi:PPOX class probable F420-dependent enzyme
MVSNQSGSPLGLRLVPPYERFWHAEAHLSAGRASVFNSVLGLRDAKYLLLESQRTDGTWAGTRMWFAAVNNTIFLRIEADSPKLRRMSRRPIVKVAACTMRGKPLDDYIECVARIVPQERVAQAEAALDRGYGLIRRLANVLTHNHYVYLELTPLDREKRPVARDEDLPLGARAVRAADTQPDNRGPDAA